MKTGLFTSVLALILGLVFASFGRTDDILIQFAGGIGVIPVSSAGGTANADGTFPAVNRNAVRGVNPPGQIWRIDDLQAAVKTDGTITIKGHGLLLAGGNGVGTTGGLSVFATLICEPKAPFTLSNTNLAGVPLAANGDFHISDVLTPAPANPCTSPVLLIRNTANQAWFAAGIQKTGEGQD